MKKVLTIQGLLLSLGLILSPVALSQDINHVNFSQDPWPPFTLGEEGTPTGGVDVDITHEIFQRLHISTSIKLFPWKRALKQMELGQLPLS